MILIGRYNHQALIGLGATFVLDEPDGNTYVLPDGLNVSAYATQLLVAAKSVKIAALSAACKAEITAGFASSALGSAHKYDGELEWQLNLAGAKDYAVATNLSVNFTCTNQTTGAKAAVAHTPAQIQAVFNDGAAFKMARLARFRALKAQVEAATTVAAVEAVNW